MDDDGYVRVMETYSNVKNLRAICGGADNVYAFETDDCVMNIRTDILRVEE